MWWFFSDRMKRAQEAIPNKGHFALAELARRKEGFFVVNQNIDGEFISYFYISSSSSALSPLSVTCTQHIGNDEKKKDPHSIHK